MKRRIINAVVDILLIMIVFSITDLLMEMVFQSDKMLLELMVYIAVYALVFGAKSLVMRLWSKKTKKED